jgi:anti-sigma factor (TIGR02949 family)
MTMPRPIDCESAMRRLWEYLDGALGDADAEAIRAHVADCAGCRAHTEFERGLLGSITAARDEHDDPARLRAAVLEKLRAAGLPRP